MYFSFRICSFPVTEIFSVYPITYKKRYVPKLCAKVICLSTFAYTSQMADSRCKL